MAVLGEGQFEIDGVTFGGIWDNVKIASFETPTSSWDTQDATNQFTVGKLMGQDLLRPGEWTFTMNTDAYSMDEARDAADRLAAVWQKGGTRAPGSLSTLRYRVGNRTRQVYGRGRRFVHSLDAWSRAGTSPILATFEMADPFFYADDLREVSVGYTPPVTGGLVAPIKAPITAKGTGATGVGGFIQNVGGTAPTPVIVDLVGPTQYAKVAGDGWFIHFDAPIAYDEVVTVDTRFGVAIARDNFGRIRNGNLSWKTNLNKARITPGTELITYQGYDLSGLSRATVRWRPAYHSY